MRRRAFLTAAAALGSAPSLLLAQSPANLGRLWDVIVVGSGIAGLSAAVSAAECGAQHVLVVEKLQILGGHSRLSTGSFCGISPKRMLPFNVHLGVDQVLEEMLSVGGGLGNRDLCRLLLSQSESAMDWLESMGVIWNPEPFVSVGSLSAESFRSVNGFSGSHYIYKLNAKAREKGVQFLYGQPVTDLLQDHRTGGVNGVVIKNKNREVVYLRSRAVVLATGGFTGNPHLCSQLNPSISPRTPSTANPARRFLDGATGDALDFTKPFNADTVDLEHIQMICFLGGRLLDYSGADIYVNSLGRRFVNESASHGAVRDAILKQPGKRMWVLTDAKSKKGLSIEDKLAAGSVLKLPNIEEAAKIVGCAPEALKFTLERYNGFVQAGRDTDFWKDYLLQTIDTPPYYVGEEHLGLHYCCGGLKFNAKAQVLNKKGQAIPGLYAAGEVTGGLHGKDRLGGTGLTEGVVFGRIAGREAFLFNPHTASPLAKPEGKDSHFS